MASPDLQAKANALNAKLEGEAKVAIDSIQKNSLRPIARDSYACVTSCYDKADKNTREEDIEICSRKCQIRYQTAAQILQQVSLLFLIKIMFSTCKVFVVWFVYIFL